MARITIEDCLEQIPNPFELVLTARKRARDLLNSGEEPKVPWNNDKATVVALREIAEGFVGVESSAEAVPTPSDFEKELSQSISQQNLNF